MIELKKKQETTNIILGKFDKRIKSLEILTTKLTERISEESQKRNELNNIHISSSENNNYQIKTIKESIEQLASIFNTSLIETKKSLEEKINKENSSLKEIFQEKSKLIDEILTTKKSENFNYQSILNDYQKKLENFNEELNSYKSDLNEKNKKIENFEKIVNDDHVFFEEQINNINNQFITIEKESAINKTFKTNVNKNLADLESEIREQNEIINKIKLDYDSYMTTFESKLNKYYSNFSQETEKLIKFKEDIYTHIDLNDNKFMTKIKELSDLINKETTLQQNEIENFEKHILEEHNHFSDFFQEKLKNIELNMNKNLLCNDEDNKQLKLFVNNLKEESDNLKIKINENINELNKFHNKKNDTLLKILMNNNLVPPDFDYKSFCAWNSSGTDNYLMSSSSYRNNNNIINNNYYDENTNY